MYDQLKSVKVVRDLVNELEGDTGDAESAHSTEDKIHRSVLKSIADGNAEDPKRMAKEALRTLTFKFPRWCA